MALNVTKYKSVLKPENSIVAGLATIGLVYGVYTTHVGPATAVAATPVGANGVSGSIKTSGIAAMTMVAAISLIAKDPNIFILGMAAVVALHSHYRWSENMNPETGMIENPGPSSYQNAQYQVPQALQAVA